MVMDMKKFLGVLVLTGALLSESVAGVSAAAAPSGKIEEMAQILSALDIMTGSENGDFMLSKKLTRAEFAKLVIAASPLSDGVGETVSVSPYPDVPYTHWAAPYIQAAVSAGYINGYLDGTFHPDEEVTLAMGVSMAVRLLGYQDSNFTGNWPSGQMSLYYNLDLDEGISIGADTSMTRLDAMYLFYNLLTAKMLNGQVFLNTLGYSLTASGEIDRVALINDAMEGPVIMQGDWTREINFDVGTAKVYRGGRASTLSALQTGDVIYYSKSMRTLWAFHNKVTGLIQAVSPNPVNPSGITVAGKSYNIETASAALALSSTGEYQVGDTVTLLLGRSGGVAGVASGKVANLTMYGVVTDVKNDQYIDDGGREYTAKTVWITGSDGMEYRYPVEDDFKLTAGAVVEVSFMDGKTTVKRAGRSSLSGKVNADGTRIGDHKLAENIDILDIDPKSGAVVKLSPSRLAGMEVKTTDVALYRKNGSDEVDILILNDATGDVDAYGIMLLAYEGETGVSYRYDVKGTTYSYVGQHPIRHGLSEGPAQIKGSLQQPEDIKMLTRMRLTSLDSEQAIGENHTVFPLWDDVLVYIQSDQRTYRLSDLDLVRTGYSLTGWYDKPVSEGGRIRVIIAK